ncbi:helix-turn-helix domain-containing protein, partial [Kaarinaea lacus]
LYYRINVIRIKLPPLRARKADIRLLASYFMIRENQRHGRNVVLGSDALDALENYSWPGNVRQLENVIVRLVIMTEDQNITVREIEAILAEDAQIDAPVSLHKAPVTDTDTVRPYQRVSTDERQTIIQVLNDARGNKTAAARKLGLTSRQLYYRMRKLDIPLTDH